MFFLISKAEKMVGWDPDPYFGFTDLHPDPESIFTEQETERALSGHGKETLILTFFFLSATCRALARYVNAFSIIFQISIDTRTQV